jgi:hypothetical protein
MNTPTKEVTVAFPKIISAAAVAVGVGVTATALWFFALLTAYGADRAFELALKQAIWLLPTSMVLAVPVSMSLSKKKKS